MKKLTVNTIKGLNFGQKSKLAHAIAKTTILEGCYAVKLKFAWKVIKNNSVNQINGLLFPNAENIAKAVMEYKKEKNISIETPSKKAPNKKEGKKAPSKKAPKKKKKEEEEKEKLFFPSYEIPQNIRNIFGENTYNTVKQLVDNYVSKNENKVTENTLIDFKDGLQKLEYVNNINELQVFTMTYFLKGYLYNAINKNLNYGVSYKKLEKKSNEQLEKELSYMNASSNSGKITSYDIEDIYNEMIIMAYEKTFSSKMFESIQNVFMSLFFRVSNTVMTEKRRLQYQTKISFDDVLTDIENGNINEYTYNYSMNILESIDFLTEKERYVIKKKIEGYNNKEIAKINGKSANYFNRTIKSYEEKLQEKTGMTIKQAKKEIEEEQKTLKQKENEMKQAIKERKEKEKENTISESLQYKINEYNLTGTHSKVTTKQSPSRKTLKEVNTIMIDEVENMKRWK